MADFLPALAITLLLSGLAIAGEAWVRGKASS